MEYEENDYGTKGAVFCGNSETALSVPTCVRAILELTWGVYIMNKVLICLLLLEGCVSSDFIGAEDRDRYIDFCRETALTPVEKEDPEDPMTKADWMVYPCSMTTQEFKKDYRIVYADAQYLSFRCEDYSYTGGAHGNTTITVGTIDRKTGKVLKINDVFPPEGRDAMLKILREKAVKAIGGESELQSEPTIIENFCLMKDGWHFIYNQYEIACYATGAVEVVIEK